MNIAARQLPIYLDNMATTPVDPEVMTVMQAYLGFDGIYGNAASSHVYGQQAANAIQAAREAVALTINAEPSEIIWTSGATEANNLAIKGAAIQYQRQGKHIITCQTEHKAVLDCVAFLEREHGFSVTYLPVLPSGLIDIEQLQAALSRETSLVSIMLVNNEIGVIQDIQTIAKCCHQAGALLHVDAAQALGKVSIDVKALACDLLSLTAHKAYGPKGIGALYRRQKPKLNLQTQLHGGGQEFGLRSGTLATHQIMGFAKACELVQKNFTEEVKYIAGLRDRLWQGIKSLPGVQLNGDGKQRVAHNLNISVAGVNGEALYYALQDVALSQGSACSAAAVEPSHVLLALGLEKHLALGSLRISIGRFTSDVDIERSMAILQREIQRLHQLSHGR